jgi:hypothetical protein
VKLLASLCVALALPGCFFFAPPVRGTTAWIATSTPPPLARIVERVEPRLVDVIAAPMTVEGDQARAPLAGGVTTELVIERRANGFRVGLVPRGGELADAFDASGMRSAAHDEAVVAVVSVLRSQAPAEAVITVPIPSEPEPLPPRRPHRRSRRH